MKKSVSRIYLMEPYINKLNRVEESLSRILQILSVNVFQKVTINGILTDPTTTEDHLLIPKQLPFRDFNLDASEIPT